MKHLNKLLVLLMLAMSLSSYAQDDNNKWAVAFGVNAIDTRTSAGGGSNWLNNHFSKPFEVKENWNIIPTVSYISVFRYIGSNLSVGLEGSVNRINKYVRFAPTTDTYIVSNPGRGDIMYYSTDVSLKYSFATLIHSGIIDPSLRIGVGYNFTEYTGFGNTTIGAGLTLWFTKAIGLFLETGYKRSFGRREDANGDLDAPSYFQHVVGVVFKFVGKDVDKDGILDANDDCPDIPGIKKFNGCPDTDGDGIPDADDDCPVQAGSAALKGCLDKDGDGIVDKDDKCPNVVGLKKFSGCPDTDGDGIPDRNDNCPREFGLAALKGCPDKDEDGVADKDDKCPDVAGSAENNGCPRKAVNPLVEFNMKAGDDVLLFEFGKSTLGKGSDVALYLLATGIQEIIKDYPNIIFTVGGHTDNIGSEKVNLKISRERADVVMKALIERGVSPNNLIAKGYGYSQPVANNDTAEGRAKNRRTEIKYIKSGEEGKM